MDGAADMLLYLGLGSLGLGSLGLTYIPSPNEPSPKYISRQHLLMVCPKRFDRSISAAPSISPLCSLSGVSGPIVNEVSSFDQTVPNSLEDFRYKLKTMNANSRPTRVIRKKKATSKNAKTWVCWDIDSCPVPNGHDACLVGPSIDSALDKDGYTGPLTITALGNLKPILRKTPADIRKLCNSGIHLNHVRGFAEIFDKFLTWTLHNQPPANILLITGRKLAPVYFEWFSTLERQGYTILQANPRGSPQANEKSYLWGHLLLGPIEGSKTNRLPRRATYFCSTCNTCPGDSEAKNLQQKQERSSRNKWTASASLDKVLADIVLKQIQAGNRRNNFFDRKTWTNMCNDFNEQTGLSFNNNQLRRHLDVLRQRYNSLKSKNEFVVEEEDTRCILELDLWEE
ncbi:unnamed protein product [Microthlaspi erraticum]|uniref:Myb/SANT-like domain-containing protein n=1 Tax=Microthlaspi erraticum TaxID=1685480 RepID=A0A6D2K1Z9_9BRAS|nr:unnamed protein product [Microthlaspi erraticum]